jgi:hypothetical protein
VARKVIEKDHGPPRRDRLSGWQAWQEQTAAGAVESGQRVVLEAPALPFDEAGARALGSVYWAEVERSLHGLVRPIRRGRRFELRVLGIGPPLLRFGDPTIHVSPSAIACAYPITGGLLARAAQGSIRFEQRLAGGCELFSTIEGFLPRLAARQGRPRWTGALYTHVQSRIHLALSRRYFARLVSGGGG